MTVSMASNVLHNAKQIKSQWIENIKELLCEPGFSGILITQIRLNGSVI